MEKEEFVMSKNLLKDVITKQTGSLTKAIKELVQNGIDAEATEISILIKDDQVIVKDNGNGMTPKEIKTYFKVFGDTAKRDTQENIGQFGMGRGQIMSFGVCTWKTLNSVIVVDIKKFMGYEITERKKAVNGCKVICKFNKELDWWQKKKTANSLHKALLPGPKLSISINGNLLKPEIELMEEFSDKLFDVYRSNDYLNYIYCRGIAVKSIDSNFHFHINVKFKAELNFARNEFLETDPMYERVKTKINEIEELMTFTKDKFDDQEARQTLQFLRYGRVSLPGIVNKPIIKSATDRKYSFSELEGKEVMFGGTDIWSDDCMRRGHIVLHEDNRFLFEELIDKFNLNIKISDKTPKQVAKRGYHRDFSIDNLKRNKIYGAIPKDMDKFIFKTLGEEFERNVYLGESDVAGGWTDGWDYIYVNKNAIELSKNKEEICQKVWWILCHEYSHDSDNRKKDYHSEEFFEKFHDLTKKTLERLAEYIRTVSQKRLKELYF